MRWIIILFILRAQANLIEKPQNMTSSPCSDRNHFFLAPGVLTAGGTSRTCISRFYPEGSARMVVTLFADDGQSTNAVRDLAPGDGGCLDISVPQRSNSKAELHVSVRYPEAKCTWERRITLRISSGRVVVMHTEKARYRPGDTLRFRAIVLKSDLTPAHSNIDEIWLEGPVGAWGGVKLAAWRRVRTRLGLAQLQHALDDLAPGGTWTARARLSDGSEGSTTFEVGNYELPPFQLTVRHAPRILRTSERLVWTVCVRYPWSEAVEGMLVIRLRGAGGLGEGAGGIRTAVRLKAPRPCHRHAAASKRIGLDGQSSPDVVIADFSFQEEGTRVWQNTTVVSLVVDDPVTLEFLTKRRAVISSGLPYKIKVKAIRWDDKPASNESVRVCRSPALALSDEFLSNKSSCVESITDAKGIARVIFTADDDCSPYYNFQASINNVTAQLQAQCIHSRGRAALGPLRADSRARTLLPLYLALPDLTTAITVHFVVITRGGTIYRWGATTQCPIASATDQIQTSPRNSICPNTNTIKLDRIFQKNLDARNTSELDSLMDRHLSKIMLPIKVSHQMCPDSHLIAYFYYKNELITATKHFEMEECFPNKVELSWSTRQAAPGAPAALSLGAAGPALCALAARDAAARRPPGLRAELLAALRGLVGGHRNLTEHDAAGECFLLSDAPDVPSSSIELMSSSLASAGVRLLGGETFQRHCSPTPAKLIADDAATPRSDFSESWLWRLVGVGANGSATVTARAPDSVSRFEARALCLSKSGVAISQPAVLQVFREFFIHASAPHRLRRGDSAVVTYRIFNYLYQPLSIEIHISTDRLLEAPSEQLIEGACVPARASIARRLTLTARAPGTARLRLRARAGPAHCSPTGGPDGGPFDGVGASDEVMIRIEVDPEGVPVQEYRSALICGRNSPNFTSSPEASWSWAPVEAVPGTETMTLWATGDVFGPLLADADGLIQLPRGCGEQNMARLATNLLAVDMMRPGQETQIARDHVARGLSRQLQYAGRGGGFSTWGEGAPGASEPSAWLTAFCLRYLPRAFKMVSGSAPPPPLLERSRRWLASRQLENGCFRPDGHVFHHELQGGLNEDVETSNVALTAYIVTSLLDSSSPLPPKLIRNSLSCLRALPSKSKNPSRIYAHAIITYAFMRLRRYEESRSNEAFEEEGLREDEELQVLVEFLKMAKRTGEYVWWDTGNLSTSIEATGYALLALAQCGAAQRPRCAADVAGAARWLAGQRTAGGGFVSTQDTLVALEGLSQWRDLLPTPSNVTVTIRSEHRVEKLHLTADVTVPKVVKTKPSEKIKVTIEGGGCALVQATRAYNAPARGAAGAALGAALRVRTQGAFDCSRGACACAALLEVCTTWSGPFPPMALVEVALPSGYAPDAERLYAQLANNTLLRRIELSPNSGKTSVYLGTRDGSDTLSRAGRHCFNIHAVGPKVKTKPAYVKIIDYYRPYVKDTQMYTIPEDCPSEISDKSDSYSASDNLFKGARSLTDSGEIVISHDYSFDDIPEGIPLDDPMFENLIKNYIKTEVNAMVIDDEKYNVAENVNSYNMSIKIDDNLIVKDIESKDLGTVNNKTNDVKVKETFVDGPSEDELSTLSKETHPEIGDRDDSKANIKSGDALAVDNPSLSTFHVIDSEKDLEVPTGIEGPIPAVALPPKNFVVPSDTGVQATSQSRRTFQGGYYNGTYYQPVYYQNNYFTKKKLTSVAT